MLSLRVIKKATSSEGTTYVLEDANGVRVSLGSDVLKEAVQEGRIRVINAKHSTTVAHSGANDCVEITRDMVCRANQKKSLSFKRVKDVNAYTAKYMALGGADAVKKLSDGVAVVAFEDTAFIVTSAKPVIKNAERLFFGTEFTKIDLRGVDTSKATSMRGMFAMCKDLVELNLSGLDTSNVTNMSNMFYYNELTKLDLCGFITTNVTDMSGMFSYCHKLTELRLQGVYTASLVNMKDMFCGCESLQSLDVSCFDTSNVTSMSGAFKECRALTELRLDNFNTSKVTDMFEMFKECSSLTTLDLHNFDTAGVLNMVDMFRYCYGLRSLDLSGFTLSKRTMVTDMFDMCHAEVRVKDKYLVKEAQQSGLIVRR